MRDIKNNLDRYAEARSLSEKPLMIDGIAEGEIRNSVSAFFARGDGEERVILMNELLKYYEKRKLKY